ncbi:MAG: ATP-binding protein [Gemmatimonadaceae bacterium]
MTEPKPTVEFERSRLEALLAHIERMAAGEPSRLSISSAHDELDAIAHGVNVLADEVQWTNARIADAERLRATDLQRENEQLEHANDSKSVFLRTASHEIRTPIAAILGIADQLAFSGLSEDDQLLVERLRENSRALLALVGNVLDLSRLDADKITLTIERISPLELVTEVVKSIEPDARRKQLPIHIFSELPSWLTIVSDRPRLRQILLNVVANAVKFTQRGEVQVLLRSEQVADQLQLTIDVTDSGIGIDPGQRQYLFVPFGQADSSIARVHGGTGLGLALSSRLAERLGGRLELHRSEPGKGSTFRLTLASELAVGARPASTRVVRDREVATQRALQGLRVLIADDHPDLRMTIGHSLEMDGASIAYAHDGGVAVEMAKTGEFDVVLMDILMPVMNGLQATRALRADGHRVPVITISADAGPEVHAASLAAGCNGHLAKPFESSDLTASILSVRASVPPPGAA